MSKFLIVGLGNIGEEYAHTRHNIGFDVLDHLAKETGGKFKSDRLAEVGEVKYKGKTLILVKPTTFMNLSGRAFKYWMDKEKVLLQNTLTVVDDLALPIDKLRLRSAGTHAGHNGLKDIQAILGTDAYPKLRFGIGNIFPKGMQADFVLSKWHKEEIETVKKKIAGSVEVIENFACIGAERAMNICNTIVF